MKNILFYIMMLVATPLTSLIAQQSKWSIETSGGGNFSFNRLEHKGNTRNLKLPIAAGAYFDFRASYSLTNKLKLLFGGSGDMYKFKYKYYYELKIPAFLLAVGKESTSSVFVWGLDLGLENTWMSGKKFRLSSGYGLKYKLSLGGPAFFGSSSEELSDDNNIIIYKGFRRDYDWNANNEHLILAFIYVKPEFKLKSNFTMFFKLTYNQGIFIHDTFYFEAKHEYPQQGLIDYENYRLFSRTTNLSYGIGFSYTFNKLKRNRIEN